MTRPTAVRSDPFIRRLRLRDFRSWEHLDLEAGPLPVVLTGANGSGKTNLLEAASFLAPGRGLVGARLADIPRRGGPGAWSVVADITAGHATTRVGTGTPGDEDARGRLVRIDGENCKGQAPLAEIVSLMWLTPSMDGLFREPAQHRRRFFDRMVCVHDPLHARRIGAYERAMRERLRLLREMSRDAAWLAALEGTMAETGVAVAAARREFRDFLAPVLAAGTAPFPGATLDLAGLIETWITDMPAVDAEARFRDRLVTARRRDAEQGMTGEGPHRTDLVVHHLEAGMEATLCSTGQQKALVIAILMASARLAGGRRAPVLLLDDVVSHLDRKARESLLTLILDLGLQAWMTGTDRDLFDVLDRKALFFHVTTGSARRLDVRAAA